MRAVTLSRWVNLPFPMARSFEFHARTVSVLTFLSRLTGLARDAAMSRVFGVGMITDAFSFAFMVPNLFRRLFGEGALTSSFLPVYARLHEENPPLARALARMVLSRIAAFLAALCILGEIILWIAWPSGGQESVLLSARLVAVLLPYMPFICLVALMGAVLQVHHRFGPTAAAPIILNVLLVITIAGLAPPVMQRMGFNEIEPNIHITIVASSVLLAGALQWAWSAWALRGIDLRSGVVSAESRQKFRQVITQALPMALGLGVLQVNTFVDGLIASYPTIIGPTIFDIAYPLEKGSMASLSFAQRLYEFPLGVFGISIATAIFPQLSRQAADVDAFRASIVRALRLVMFIGFPASIALMIMRVPLTAAVFQGDSFSAEDTQRVAIILLAYAPAIWAYSGNHLLTRAFYARGESMTPVIVAASMVVLNFILNITLIWTPLKTSGLALSTAICAILQMIILERLLARRIGSLVTLEVRASWMRTVIASAVMGLALAGAMFFAPENASWWMRIGVVLALVAIGAAAYFIAAKALRMPEVRWALGKQ